MQRLAARPSGPSVSLPDSTFARIPRYRGLRPHHRTLDIARFFLPSGYAQRKYVYFCQHILAIIYRLYYFHLDYECLRQPFSRTDKKFCIYANISFPFNMTNIFRKRIFFWISFFWSYLHSALFSAIHFFWFFPKFPREVFFNNRIFQHIKERKKGSAFIFTKQEGLPWII